MVEPLNDGELDKIFGTETPDFTGDDSAGEMVECCHSHFLAWLSKAVETGEVANLSSAELERAIFHLKGASEALVQVADEEAMGVAEAMSAAGPMGKMLGLLLEGVIMEAENEDGTLKIQVLEDGMRIIAGGKSIKLAPYETVFLAGTIGGWIWKSEKMREVLLERIREVKEQVEEAEG